MDEEIFEEVSEKVSYIDFTPEHVQIFPTNRCNADCIFCWRHRAEKIDKDKISYERLVDLIENACELGPEILSISGGGEPLLRRKFVKKAAEIAQRYGDIKTELITNGISFDEDIVKSLINNELECVRLSLNAPRSETEDYLLGREKAFQEQIESLEMIRKQKNKLNSYLPDIDLSMVVTKYNFKYIQEMIHIANRYDASLQIRTVIEPYGEEKKFSVPTDRKDEFLREVENAENLAQSLSVDFEKDFKKEDLIQESDESEKGDGTELPSRSRELSIDDLLQSLENKNKERILSEFAACELPFLEINIFADGWVAPCAGAFFTGNQDVSVISDYIDSVFEKSLREIWNGEKFNRMRTLSLLQSLPEPCKNCNENFVKQSENLKEELLKDN